MLEKIGVYEVTLPSEDATVVGKKTTTVSQDWMRFAIPLREDWLILSSLYRNTFAAHCIDWILEDFGNLDWISTVIKQAK